MKYIIIVHSGDYVRLHAPVNDGMHNSAMIMSVHNTRCILSTSSLCRVNSLLALGVVGGVEAMALACGTPHF